MSNAGVTVLANVPLAPFSTMGLGGPARYFCEVASEGQTVAALQWAKEKGVPAFLLGGGSNVLIDDAGYPGLVIRMASRGRQAHFEPDALVVRVAAGEAWDDFVAWSVFQGASGLECLSGIPGQVGATPIQNVGAYGQEVAETIAVVDAIERATGKPRQFTARECGFAYRHSRFKAQDRDAFVITAVTFRLALRQRPRIAYADLQQELAATPGWASLEPGRERGEAVRDAVIRIRRRKSMVVDPRDPDSRSLGSFFLNPMLTAADHEVFVARAKAMGLTPPPAYPQEGLVKVPAAWLIEKAGVPKGFAWQGAGVSRAHTLALVNRGGTAADVKALARHIQGKVREAFGIALEPEPLFL